MCFECVSARNHELGRLIYIKYCTLHETKLLDIEKRSNNNNSIAQISERVCLNVSLYAFYNWTHIHHCAGNYHYIVITRMQMDVGDIFQEI